MKEMKIKPFQYIILGGFTFLTGCASNLGFTPSERITGTIESIRSNEYASFRFYGEMTIDSPEIIRGKSMDLYITSFRGSPERMVGEQIEVAVPKSNFEDYLNPDGSLSGGPTEPFLPLLYSGKSGFAFSEFRDLEDEIAFTGKVLKYSPEEENKKEFVWDFGISLTWGSGDLITVKLITPKKYQDHHFTMIVSNERILDEYYPELDLSESAHLSFSTTEWDILWPRAGVTEIQALKNLTNQ